jgi:hypothetical protein
VEDKTCDEGAFEQARSKPDGKGERMSSFGSGSEMTRSELSMTFFLLARIVDEKSGESASFIRS